MPNDERCLFGISLFALAIPALGVVLTFGPRRDLAFLLWSAGLAVTLVVILVAVWRRWWVILIATMPHTLWLLWYILNAKRLVESQ